MKKFAEEAFKLFWIPLIMGLVSYIFFSLKDVMLGIVVLVALSAAYTLIRLYVTYKKWWLLIILVVVLGASGGYYYLRTPNTALSINGNKVSAATVSVQGGSISINPAPKSGKYNGGEVITLTASPAAGYDFKAWTGTDKNTANPTTVKLSGNMDITANFEQRYSLIINNQPIVGSFVNLQEGSVTINPAPDSDGKYKNGTQVQLTVKANTGYDFTGWSGTTADTTNPTSVVMTGGNQNITVNFAGRFSLYISDQMVISAVLMLQNGSILVNPSPSDDGKYAYGTQITLTAKPNTGYGWLYWSGTSADTSNPATLVIKGDKHTAVTFEARYLIMVNNQALANGTIAITGGNVTANPAPGTDGRYAKDSITTLSANPLAGYRFDRWNGDISDTVTSVSLPMSANKNIVVVFIKIWNLITQKNINDGGTVSAGGIYDEGKTVTVTATAAAGYRFGSWGGDASGNSASTTVTINGDKTAMANFIKTWNLTVASDPAAGGTVTPASGTYDTGTTVTLTAHPASGYVFDHWTGSVSDNASVSANVTMNADQGITAYFVTSP
jgi:uncharacterized repeat protein (TIGR02543 family)